MTQIETRRDVLNRELEKLEDELPATPLPERDEISSEIERVERELRELAVDERNRASMEGGSEA